MCGKLKEQLITNQPVLNIIVMVVDLQNCDFSTKNCYLGNLLNIFHNYF